MMPPKPSAMLFHLLPLLLLALLLPRQPRQFTALAQRSDDPQKELDALSAILATVDSSTALNAVPPAVSGFSAARLRGDPDVLDVYSKETSEACALAKHVPVGCSVYKACQDEKFEKGFCAPQSVWNDVCSDDLDVLRRDGVCERYQENCIESKTDECDSGLPNMLKTSEVRALIKEMCLEMPKMKQCGHCKTGECGDPFMSAYVPLCVSMPNMHECKPWRDMCTTVKESQIKTAWRCSSKKEELDPPPMRMYLHFSRLDYVLFSWWVPRTSLSYALACLTCFFTGLISSTARIYRVRAEAHWGRLEGEHPDAEPQWFAPPSFALNLNRAVLVAFVSLLDFAVMLLVMTFNGGIIISCVAGLAFGHLLFGHMTSKRAVPTCCSPLD